MVKQVRGGEAGLIWDSCIVHKEVFSLWIGCDQQSGKFMDKQDVAIQPFFLDNHENSHPEITLKFQHTLRIVIGFCVVVFLLLLWQV